MKCTHCREALSARLDGEDNGSEGALIEAHLTTCAECRRFADDAAHVTRLARTAVATEVPDLVDAVLAAAPRSRAPRLITVLRVLLGVVGVAQLAVAVALAGVVEAWTGDRTHDEGAYLSGASLQHFAHESAAWNLALGACFVWVAWRRSRTSGVVPTVATFVVVLTGLEVLDLVAGRVALDRLLLHGLVLLGLALVILLDRRRPVGGALPGGTSAGRWWASPVPQPDPAPGAVDAGDAPGLRPTARHHGTAATQRRTA